MKRFLFILIALSCLFACKKQEQEVLPPEDPDTPEENEEVPPTPYDADDVDWAAGLGYVFDDAAYVREIFCYDLFHRSGVWTALYKKYLQDLCAEGGDFHYKTAMARIRAWQNTIAPFVSNDTQEDMAIEDKPGWWGNHHEYRIMEEGENNFFQVKAEAVGKM